MTNGKNPRQPSSNNNRKKTHGRPAKSDIGQGSRDARDRIKGHPGRDASGVYSLDIATSQLISHELEGGRTLGSTGHNIYRNQGENGGVKISCHSCPDTPSVESGPVYDRHSATSIVPWSRNRDLFLFNHPTF